MEETQAFVLGIRANAVLSQDGFTILASSRHRYAWPHPHPPFFYSQLSQSSTLKTSLFYCSLIRLTATRNKPNQHPPPPRRGPVPPALVITPVSSRS